MKSVPFFLPCDCQRSVLVTEPTCLSPCAASLWGVVGSAIWPSAKGAPQLHHEGINISAGSCICVQFQLAFVWLDGLLLTVSNYSLWTEIGFTQVLAEQQKGGCVHLKRRGFGSHPFQMLLGLTLGTCAQYSASVYAPPKKKIWKM